MNISVQKLLAKMEEELMQAKAASKQENLRERIYSIKILCELILDEKQAKAAESWNEPVIGRPVPVVVPQQPAVPIVQQPVSTLQLKKLELEDEANGDSLFDF
ncbi:YwdI family protein [Neobacillus kokaensis]|uniref:YwdI family protein n=1 Tax=Neobacillus kokaensis TaxID=2759023 RepID=A0ABQ3N1W5_9BACI|nr:YwdI family protein [Neobacillus kokaensis]GHH97978.1 hypothetical protein AM1BK_15210 [Neobacillus kokaensis]